LVIWTRREGIGDVEVEIGDAGTGREKGGDRGLRIQSVCAPLRGDFWLLGLADRANEARTACNQDMCAVEVEGKIHDTVKRRRRKNK
jgi:hypothetical protein